MASKQLLIGGHCNVMLNGLMDCHTPLLNPLHFLENIVHILYVLYICSMPENMQLHIYLLK